jgi:hypothetical protein
MISTVEKKYNNNNNEFVAYKMTLSDGKIWSVPLDEANSDYQAIQEWIKEGGVVIDNPPQENN